MKCLENQVSLRRHGDSNRHAITRKYKWCISCLSGVRSKGARFLVVVWSFKQSSQSAGSRASWNFVPYHYPCQRNRKQRNETIFPTYRGYCLAVNSLYIFLPRLLRRFFLLAIVRNQRERNQDAKTKHGRTRAMIEDRWRLIKCHARHERETVSRVTPG